MQISKCMKHDDLHIFIWNEDYLNLKYLFSKISMKHAIELLFSGLKSKIFYRISDRKGSGMKKEI